MTDIEKVRSDIELTRVELAKTIDALQARLDLRTIARDRADVAAERLAVAYAQAKAAAPDPVKPLLERAEALAGKAAADKQRTLKITGGVLLALLVLRRLRR